MTRAYMIQYDTDTPETMDRRVAALPADKYYWDKATGKGGDRPAWKQLVRELELGDTIVYETLE